MSFQQQIDEAIKKQDLYFIGEALPADWYAGFKAWLPLAEGGDAKAAFNVGTCYLRGDGVDRNTTTGLEWYRRAADAGDARALRTLNQRRADEERSAGEAQARERARNEAARSAVVVAEIRALIERKDLAGARRRAEAAVQEGMGWAGGVIAALALRVYVRKNARKEYTVLQGASTTVRVAGVYQTSPKTIARTSYELVGAASNPTSYPVTVAFQSSFGHLPAGGTLPVKASRVADVKQWASSFEVSLDDPARTVLKIPAAAGQIATGGVSALSPTTRRVLMGGGALVAFWFVHKVWWLYQMWQIYERTH